LEYWSIGVARRASRRERAKARQARKVRYYDQLILFSPFPLFSPCALRSALGAEGIILHQIPDAARAGGSAETTANTEIRIHYHFQTIFSVLFLGDGPFWTNGVADPAVAA
jgi:hypothetical protein